MFIFLLYSQMYVVLLEPFSLRARKRDILEELSQKSADFFLNIHWKFASWIPFTGRYVFMLLVFL